MAYRFTDTDKWNDAWFSELKTIHKLLFMFLCDNCNLAGFIEVNKRIWAAFTGLTIKEIEVGLDAIQKALIYSNDESLIFIRNFMKHQKNLPLNEKNKAHTLIIRQLNSNLDKFGYQDIKEFMLSPINPPSKGDTSPTGVGEGIGKVNNSVTIVRNWKTDFQIYIDEAAAAFTAAADDKKFIKDQEMYHPNVHVKKTMQRAWNEYWSLKEAWEKKRKEKIEKINWRRTISNAISLNRVFYTKQEQQELDLR